MHHVKKKAPHPSRDDDQEIKKRNLATAESESGIFFQLKPKVGLIFFSLLSFPFQQIMTTVELNNKDNADRAPDHERPSLHFLRPSSDTLKVPTCNTVIDLG
jgi:hypothetical protein